MAVQIMIPGFDENGNLPVGIHRCSWNEFKERFAYGTRRKQLIRGLRSALAHLKKAECSRVFIDGSFVTSEEEPGDYDACWDVRGVVDAILDFTFIDYRGSRAHQKSRFEGEWFPHNPNNPKSKMLKFFQWDRFGRQKGIIEINLGDFDDKE